MEVKRSASVQAHHRQPNRSGKPPGIPDASQASCLRLSVYQIPKSMGFMLPSPTSPAEHARVLMARKDTIEAEIDVQRSILTANGSTLSTPLVDADGFPRADIDIWAVRHARVRIIELRNDLKDIMDDIARALQGIYDPALRAASTVEAESKPANEPFAKVDGVLSRSPAATAVRSTQPPKDMFADLFAA